MRKTFESTFFGRPATLKAYRCLFRCHIKPAIPKPKQLTQGGLQTLVQGWMEEGYSVSTIQLLIQLTARYVRWAQGPVLETRQLCSAVGRMVTEKPVRALSREQAKQLLAHTKDRDNRLYELLVVGFQTGMRIGEIFGLQFGDLNMVKKQILISRSIDGPTKSGKSRIVPMSENVFKILEEKTYHSPELNERIFPQFKINDYLKKMCQEARVPKITSHGMRHTFCTLGLEARISPKTIQTIVGHSDPSVTLSVYWNSLPEEPDLSFVPSL